MFNWISPFNYDFAIASIPIQIILLVFYGIRRNLPIKQSFFFWLAMASNLIMTSADIISCEMNEIWMDFPLWVMYAINHAYFLGFIIRGWSLFSYTAESTHSYKETDHTFKVLTGLPALTAVILILSTPWTSAIYTIAEDGYHNCSLYKTIYFSTYFYIIASLLLVIRYWKRLSRRMKAGLLSFNLLLLFGIIIRKQFYHMLVTSYFSILTIIIIYLTSENPDLYRDNRTFLLNKDALNRIGLEFWEKKIPYSLMTISIHNYEASKIVYGISQINDELKIVANWLTQNYPKEFLFYTRNGNFVVLSKGRLEKEPSAMINEWVENYDLLRKTSDDVIPIQASMMLLPESIISKHAMIVSDLARHAINSSYEENRKGNYIFSDEMIADVKKHKAIEKAIKRAMSENSFEVYFQPIYSNIDGKVMGAEALARLNDPDIGFIPPLDFIQIAERNGDIIEIGKQIFEKVCVFLAQIDAKELEIEFINVNLSPIQCMSVNLPEDLAAIAKKHGISMDIFDFEITESMIDDYDMIQLTIAGLRAMGAELSLDDFGTGAANLTSLINLPIHVVKVDMSFVRSYFAGKADFLPDLIRLFKHSKMEIVVEGIETVEMKEKMAELGCDYEQGYYFSKPIPPNDFISFMKSQHNEDSANG